MTREPVEIERGDPSNPSGMPRPLAKNNSTLRPVPWTNGDDWGILHTDRAQECTDNSLCLVCGQYVETGYIFARTKSCPVNVGFRDLLTQASDGGPLHERCAKMTVAHCKEMRRMLLEASAWMIPYSAGIDLTNDDESVD